MSASCCASLLHCTLLPARPSTAALTGRPRRSSAALLRAAANSSDASEPAATSAAASATSTERQPPPSPRAAGAAPTAAAAALPPERLRQLRHDGLALKDVIKLGRLGAAEGLAQQVARRWRTSEVARLHCHGKHAVNMKLLVQQLEDVTGGVVVHRAGGTVLLYRGDAWQPAASQQGAARRPAARQRGAAADPEQAAAQRDGAAALPPAAEPLRGEGEGAAQQPN